ncbi:glucose-6-phosphate isomerase [Anaerolineae bacterium CFX4]|nr:glucose-6-phosphate isomerase [Anaerolineae bacterium CFX4]
MTILQPFKTEIDLKTGVFTPETGIIKRYLSQMRSMFADTDAVERILADEGDRLLYEVYVTKLPEEAGQILHCTTIIHPGKIGSEFHMGCLVMQTQEGATDVQFMKPGTAAYVPPYWAHRTVNIGEAPFVFFAAWAGDAGHDYGTIERDGFRKLIVDAGGRVEVTDNPKYR